MGGRWRGLSLLQEWQQNKILAPADCKDKGVRGPGLTADSKAQ